jgi:eukaryotic-like serine/threonine-protein kinase
MGAQTRSSASVLQDVTLPDRYRIVRRIALGGMATVWCANDLVLGRHVAIKLLAEQFADDERARRRFEREARAAAHLSGHPHVVTIYDVGQTEPRDGELSGRPFIVMEHLVGGTVADALRVGAVTRGDALRWVREAAAAVDYAHGRDIVHRDIKPGNLLLDGGRSLHITDFGIARIGTEDTITGTGQLFGTAAYLSPEQALGWPATEASDRYALAVVAFELLVGERPFTAERFAAQARQHIDADPPGASSRSRKLPAALDTVLERGLAKRPEHRWGTAAAFADALEAALLDRPPRTARAPLARTARAPLARTARAPLDRPPRKARAPLASRAHVRPRSAAAAAPVPPLLASASVASRAKPPPRALALAALAATAFGVGVAAGASTERTPAPARAVAHARSHAVLRAPAAHHASLHVKKPSPTTTEASAVPAADTTPPPTAEMLEARGHQLMLDGNYPAAVPALHQALASTGPGSLTYAYALFDLGRSLRLAGDPQAAVGILQRRLQIPNQTRVVRQELELALRAIGASTQPSGGAAPSPPGAVGRRTPRAHHKRHGRQGDGGG